MLLSMTHSCPLCLESTEQDVPTYLNIALMTGLNNVMDELPYCLGLLQHPHNLLISARLLGTDLNQASRYRRPPT